MDSLGVGTHFLLFLADLVVTGKPVLGKEPPFLTLITPRNCLGPPEERLEEGYQLVSVVYFSREILPTKKG